MASLRDVYPRLRIDEALSDYMAMPESGFDKPFLMAHGGGDVNVPYPQTARYADALRANGEPVIFKTDPTDHSGTMQASLFDTIPYVRRAFRHRARVDPPAAHGLMAGWRHGLDP